MELQNFSQPNSRFLIYFVRNFFLQLVNGAGADPAQNLTGSYDKHEGGSDQVLLNLKKF